MSKPSRFPFLSPLRYPGGKSRLAAFVGLVINAQRPRPSRYVEPFAGGAGVALRLLHDEVIDNIVINDLDAGVAAFWRATFLHNDELADRIASCAPSLKEWHRQRAVYVDREVDDVALGFATFFLNRTNRSGILRGRPIGGLDQTGAWGIGARYNAVELAQRVRLLARYASQVAICEEDGISLIRRVMDGKTFLYVDPPYIEKASGLYLDTFDWSDHKRLAAVLVPAKRWLLTYDKDPRVLRLYPGLPCASFGIAHTAAVPHVGSEYAVFASDLAVPALDWLGHDAGFVRGRRPA